MTSLVRVLLPLFLFAGPLLHPAHGRAAPLMARVVSHGLELTLSLPRRSYPVNAVVQATVRVRNVSRTTLVLGLTSDYECGTYWPQVQVFRGKVEEYPPALPGSPGPSCRYRPVSAGPKLYPGRSVYRPQYAILRGERLRAVQRLGANTNVVTPFLSVPFTTGDAPLVTLAAGGSVHADLHSAAVAKGKLLYVTWWRCLNMESFGNAWQAQTSTRLSTSFPGTGCDRPNEWHAVAGWLNHSVAQIDYTAGMHSGIELQPHSLPAQQGKPYLFTLYTHCGLNYDLDFDTGFWDDTDSHWPPGSGNPPPGIGNPTQNGTMTLIDAQHAEFHFSGGIIHFARHAGPDLVPGLCS